MVKRRNIEKIIKTITNILKHSMCAKLNYTLIRNKHLLESELKIISDSFRDAPGFEIFDDERKKLCVEYCEKDEQGLPKVDGNGNYVGLVGNEEFMKSFQTLKEKYSDILQQQNELLKKFNEFMDEEVDVGFTKINTNEIPDGIINGDQLEIIFPMISELW